MGLYGAWATVAAGAPRRYALVFIGLTLIGTGSFGFHASLKWSWQLMDELPMVSGPVVEVESGEKRGVAWSLARAPAFWRPPSGEPCCLPTPLRCAGPRARRCTDA